MDYDKIIEQQIEDISGNHSSRMAPEHYGTILIAKAILVLALIILKKKS